MISLDDQRVGLFIDKYGDFRFDVSAGSITINHQIVNTSAQVVRLPIGHHQLQLNTDGTSIHWLRPQSSSWEHIPQENLYADSSIAGRGFYGRFYKDERLMLERIDPTLFSYFHHLPLERPYSAIWSAWLDVQQSGLYEFHVEAIGQVEFLINETLVLNGQNPNQRFHFDMTKDERYKIKIKFIDNQDASRFYLQWRTLDSSEFAPIPPHYLEPGAWRN